MEGKKIHLIDVELIWKSVNGTASEEELAFLDGWLGEAASHRQYYEKARQFFLEGSSSDFRDEKVDLAWKKFKEKERRSTRLSGRIVLVAASVVAGLLLTGLLYYFTGKVEKKDLAIEQAAVINPGTGKARLTFEDGRTFDLTTDAELFIREQGTTIRNKDNRLEYKASGVPAKEAEYHILQIPGGGEFSLVLSDGTKVWLNAGSLIRYPAEFTGNERRVDFEGEAYFEVAPDKERPFRIMTGNQQVEVLGTSFGITSYEEDPAILTTLVEGRVQVSLKNDPGVFQVLNPNEQSYYQKNGNTILKRTVNPSPYIAWREGRFVFQDELLVHIMQTLSRWYNVDVIFAGEKAKHFRFTGNLERRAGFKEILEKIEKTNEVKFYVKGNQITIE